MYIVYIYIYNTWHSDVVCCFSLSLSLSLSVCICNTHTHTHTHTHLAFRCGVLLLGLSAPFVR